MRLEEDARAPRAIGQEAAGAARLDYQRGMDHHRAAPEPGRGRVDVGRREPIAHHGADSTTAAAMTAPKMPSPHSVMPGLRPFAGGLIHLPSW